MRTIAAASICAAAFAVGCGDDSESSAEVTDAPVVSAATTPAPAKPAASRARGKLVRLGRTRYGTITVDAGRRALYLFTRDGRNRSRCYGACAEAWPPYYTKGTPRAGRGVRQRLLGVTRRRGGRKQVTYRGHPLYYYVGDRQPLQVLCQAVTEFGGVWYVVDRRGNAIR